MGVHSKHQQSAIDPPVSFESSAQTSLRSDTSPAERDEEGDREGPLVPPPSRAPTTILALDKNTPDAHVPRDPRLIRLTGTHPFNCEAPLTALMREGFLTSPELFFVRNHGPVPHVPDAAILDWEFTVDGLVDAPLRLTLRALLAEHEVHTYPITLVCAGNRRKEQNQVRKSNGFSWGPAGVSTALFTGVAMADVIRRARPQNRARYVCMEGADTLPNGHYGTCVKLSWVLDPNRGIMLAHEMNFQRLRPDHGRPLRAVIPGQIGGRSVKWLKRLIVTDAPSDNWYHIYDNRVLPTMVSPDVAANEPKWWTDERYAIYDLSPNSAIASPAHGETLSLVGAAESYCAKGYAYSGGGRRVTRVEVSLDQGGTWRLATVNYDEDKYRERDFHWRDTSFCWCLWTIDLPVQDIAAAKDLMVRCMDEGMCAQPRDMYWNVLGMMNNPWFRVAVHKEGDLVRFEHPTQPALMPGGWMERVKKAGGNLANGFWGERKADEEATGQVNGVVKEVRMTKRGLDRDITIEELQQHEEGTSPWFVVNGEVYDGTEFLQEHPGGAQSILGAAAADATDEFMAIHSEIAKAMMPDYHVGSLNDAGKKMLGAPQKYAQGYGQEVFLQPRTWSVGRLYAKTKISWDTRIFTYKLDHEEQILGLRTGQHLMIRLRDPVSREAIVRPYTPLSETDKKGFVDVLIKVYFGGETRKGGRMSTAMDSLPMGHEVEFKGPIGKFEYHGRGEYSLNGTKKPVKSFLMICGGSGVTPIYQVFREIMHDRQDSTTCVLLDCNRLEEDTLCQESLDALALEGQGKGTVFYTLTKGGEMWKGLRGRINKELIEEHFPHHEEAVALLCGPEGMVESVRGALRENGWRTEQVVIF